MKAGACKATASALLNRLHSLRRRNASLAPAQEGTARGTLWTVFIAVEFYLLSNPLAFQPSFGLSLNQAVEMGVLLALWELPRLRLRRPQLTLLVVAAFAGLSWFWSVDRSVTEAALWLYGAVAVLALLIAANVTTRVLVGGLAGGGLLVLAVSFYAWQQQIPAALIPPDMALDGYLAGVGTNRNILSYTMVLALGFLAGHRPRRWRGRSVWLVSVLLLLLGVFLAQSATGFLGSAVVLGLGLGLARVEPLPRRIRTRIAAATASVVVTVVVLVITFPSLLGAVMSRDSVTLSGRVPLWEAIIDETVSRRAEGYGWGTVWMHPWLPDYASDVADDIYVGAGTFMSHGHNSFLDVLPQVGLIGVVLLVLMHLVPLKNAMRERVGEQRDAETLLRSRVVITSMAAIIVFGLTEPITSTPLGWFCLCLIGALGTRAARPRARRSRRGRHVAVSRSGVADAGPLGVPAVRGKDEVHGALGAVVDRVVVGDDASTTGAADSDPHSLDDVGRV